MNEPSNPRLSSTAGAVPVEPVPLPTRRELRRRSSLLRQAVRFVVLNVKILRLSRQHH